VDVTIYYPKESFMLWIIVVIVIIGIYFFIKYQSIIAPKTSSSDISILPEQFIIVDIETTGLDPESTKLLRLEQ
jgi:DNA polymerase III alpha subunit (gram-positive type)